MVGAGAGLGRAMCASTSEGRRVRARAGIVLTGYRSAALALGSPASWYQRGCCSWVAFSVAKNCIMDTSMPHVQLAVAHAPSNILFSFIYVDSIVVLY